MKEPKSAVEMFQVIRRFFDTADLFETAAVYNAISAIRGPDNEKQCFKKMMTTAVVRHVLLGDRYPGYSGRDTDDYACARRERMDDHDHFICHARWAFEALGLKWNERNGPVEENRFRTATAVPLTKMLDLRVAKKRRK